MTKDPEQRFQALRNRTRRLFRSPESLGLSDVLNLYEFSRECSTPDTALLDILESRLDSVEDASFRSPFPETEATAALSQGNHEIGRTLGAGNAVRVSFAPNAANTVGHTVIVGKTGSGKTFLTAQLLSLAAGQCATLILDPNRCCRAIKSIRGTHRIVRLSDLRVNIFDDIPGVQPELVDAVMVRQIAQHYSLIYAERELLDTASDLRAKGQTPNLPLLESTLRRKTYPNYSKLGQYRDSAVLALRFIQASTGQLFRCSSGMDLRELLSDNIVLELDTLGQHTAFIANLVIEYCHLLSLSGEPLERRLILALDEARELVRNDDLATKLLRLRHYGISLIAGFQNASHVPLEFMGNT